MTNEETLEAAKEAGLYMTSPERIAAVERLVAIIERKTIERCAQECEQTICECCYNVDGVEAANECAAAIRKLGDE